MEPPNSSDAVAAAREEADAELARRLQQEEFDSEPHETRLPPDDAEIARRMSLQSRWWACCLQIGACKDEVNELWGGGAARYAEACDELSVAVVEFTQVIEALGGLGEDEQQSARLGGQGERDEQQSVRQSGKAKQQPVWDDWEKCKFCGGACAGSSSSKDPPPPLPMAAPEPKPEPAQEEEGSGWVCLWRDLDAAEAAVRDAWDKDAAMLAETCAKLRKLCQKLLWMMPAIREGRDPAPSELDS